MNEQTVELIFLKRKFCVTAALFGVAMILGPYAANRVIQRLPRERFQHDAAILLALIAAYMVAHG